MPSPSRLSSPRLIMAAKGPAGGAIPPDSRRLISGFPSHVDTVEGLPNDERDLLRALAEWVIETHDPGMFPVTAITCIGHADHDPARGKTFELDISERRARNVLSSLQEEIARQSFSFSPVFGIFNVASRIRFASSGVGSRDARNASTELQRRKNRRVEIIFERGPPFPPPRPIIDILELTKRVIAGMAPPVPALPKPNFFINPEPPTRAEWRDFVKAIKGSPLLRHLDIKTIVEGVIEVIGPPPESDEERHKQWTDGLIDAIKEDERERLKHSERAPGQDDDD